jgi:phosphoribosylanthranilate isomerase
MARTRIKICGIRDEDGLYAAIDAGADAVGFVFVESSPRAIRPEAAFNLMGLLPPLVVSVGVFQDADTDRFGDIEQICPVHHAQLHGAESAETVEDCGPDVIKAVRVGSPAFEEDLARWDIDENVAAILIDGPVAGSGEPLDWAAIGQSTSHLSKPVFLAGGLTPENVAEAIRLVRPYAVDVSSGVERVRGEKDAGLIEAFCEAVRRADVAG